MKAFLERWALPALQGLLGREKAPSDALHCRHCKERSTSTSTRYRCFDCHLPPVLCKTCMIRSHAHNPFHFVEEWDTKRQFWRRQPLSGLGVVLELGHEGSRCVYAMGEGRPMRIVSEHGIHNMRVRFCGCPEPTTAAVTPEATQLLQHGFWPASWEKPMTVFTINLMKTFTLLGNQANVNAYDFYEVLRRKTDGIAPQETDVSALLHTMHIVLTVFRTGIKSY